jgi:poly-gamma-glutamate capsule biosynthesis protein CapA/YwtB (metallophosphatase superfamily)
MVYIVFLLTGARFNQFDYCAAVIADAHPNCAAAEIEQTAIGVDKPDVGGRVFRLGQFSRFNAAEFFPQVRQNFLPEAAAIVANQQMQAAVLIDRAGNGDVNCAA